MGLLVEEEPDDTLLVKLALKVDEDVNVANFAFLEPY